MFDNKRIAARLREAGERLQKQGGKAFLSAAYRRAAVSVEQSPRPMRDIFDEHGFVGLEELPCIGPAIADIIAELLLTGRWKFLERLRNPSHPPHGPERVFVEVDEEGIEHDVIVVT